MAFTVTPTSGDAPYILSADIADKVNIDGVNYALEVRPNTTIGSCLVGISTDPSNTNIVQSLLATDSYMVSGNVNVGSCRTYSLIIRDLRTDTIISSENAVIDNV